MSHSTWRLWNTFFSHVPHFFRWFARKGVRSYARQQEIRNVLDVKLTLTSSGDGRVFLENIEFYQSRWNVERFFSVKWSFHVLFINFKFVLIKLEDVIAQTGTGLSTVIWILLCLYRQRHLRMTHGTRWTGNERIFATCTQMPEGAFLYLWRRVILPLNLVRTFLRLLTNEPSRIHRGKGHSAHV